MVRIIGACCITAGCAAFGLSMAAASRREEAYVARFLAALEYMSCELSYRMTPLPTLCRSAGEVAGGYVGQLLTELARELEKQIAPDVQVCVHTLLERTSPEGEVARLLRELGGTLGRFDLPGQLRGLESAIRSAGESLRRIRDGAGQRRRNYQTLGLCAGAAMAILFL